MNIFVFVLLLRVGIVNGFRQANEVAFKPGLGFTHHSHVANVARNREAATTELIRIPNCGLNVCFAVDGSGSIGADLFQTEKDFVGNLSTLLGLNSATQLAGTVYGVANENISLLTGNIEVFLEQVAAAAFPNAPATFLGAGLFFCVNELSSQTVQQDINKIVLIGDGASDVSIPFTPFENWRDGSPNNSACAVAAGDADLNALQGITEDSDLIVELSDPDAVSKVLQIIIGLVGEECLALPSATPTPSATLTPTESASPSVSPSVSLLPSSSATPTISATPSSSSVALVTPSMSPSLGNTRCPCRCIVKRRLGKSRRKASRLCRKKKFRYCSVSRCGQKGFTCCN